MKGRLSRVAFSVSGFSNQFLEARSGGAREVGGENPVKVARDIACDVCTKEVSRARTMSGKPDGKRATRIGSLK